MRKALFCALTLAVCAWLVMPLSAGVVVVGNANWYEFSWAGIGAATGCQPADPGGQNCTASSGGNSQPADAPAWTFSGPAVLTVTDAFLSADEFEVFDNLVSLGVTSAAIAGGSCGSNPDVCLLDPNYSHGVFILGAGNHSITIDQLKYPSSGAGFFRLDEVPEPSTWFLVGAPLVFFALRRKRQAR